MTILHDEHGGNIYKEARNLGVAAQDLMDYSANINPLGIPESLKQMIISNLDKVADYPDPEYNELKEDISKYLEVDINKIIPGNGATEIIYLLLEVLQPKRVLIPAPTFSEYSKAAKYSASEVVYFELKEENDFNLDMKEFFHAIEKDIDAVILCNPNNPTSTILDINSLKILLDKCCKHGVFVIIDEAFIELTDDGNANSVVSFISQYDNLFVIRAFTKYFAIPGLRLGYGIGPECIVKRMEERKLPWSVNSFAGMVGKVLSTDRTYIEKTEIWIKNEKKWLYQQLSEIEVLKVFEPKTNFILVKILAEGLNADILQERMLTRNILIRHAGNFMFLNDKFFRIAVKDKKRNIIFLKALREVMEEWC